jgi:hypothetical protein
LTYNSSHQQTSKAQKMTIKRHPLAHVLIAFAEGQSVECRVRPSAHQETAWRKASLQDVANGAADVEFRVLDAQRTQDTLFGALFNDAIEGLREFYPLTLGDQSKVEKLRAHVAIGWSTTGNNQKDYSALRDALEFRISAVEISDAQAADVLMVELRFHPQAWQNDNAIDADAEGDTDWSIPLSDIENGVLCDDDSYETDDLRNHSAAPQWVKDWSGPFWVEIVNREDLLEAGATEA